MIDLQCAVDARLAALQRQLAEKDQQVWARGCRKAGCVSAGAVMPARKMRALTGCMAQVVCGRQIALAPAVSHHAHASTHS